MKRKSKEEVLEEFRIQSILDATMRVVARKGLVEATMQEIADEAEIAKGTIYLYFADRDDLLNQTVEHAFGELTRRMDEAFETPNNLTDRLTLIMRTHFGFFEENHDFFRVYMAMSDRCSDTRKRHQHPLYRAYLQRLASIFDEGLKGQKSARFIDTNRLATFVAEGTRALIFQRIEEKQSPPLDEDVKLIVSTILHGITERGKH